MKFKYTGIIASAIFALGFSSCLDLDTAPLDQKSDATMWQTTDDAMAGVSILYKILPDAMWLTPEDIYTDNAVYGIKWAAGNRAHGTWSVDDFDWGTEYTYIRYANLVFANIDRVQDISESDRNNILGQAHFFRAYIYGELIKQFGDVPYIDKPLELSEQGDITREDWEVVYNKMIEDYDKAIQLLPATTSDGRVNKAVAYGFKARHALYFANPDCQHYIASGYQTAADCAKAIMDMGVYELYDGNYSGTAKDYTGKYAEMFWGLNMLNSKEALICKSSIASLNQGSYYIGFSAFPTVGWGGTNPTQGFVDCFEDCEGAPIEKSQIYDPLHPDQNRDPRLNANVIFSGDKMYGIEVNTKPLKSAGVRALYGNADACGDATLTGYHTKKWLNPDVYPGSDGWNHDASPACMRYTEVLLTYAEAKNELSPLDPEAFAAVNKVRARVGMPALQNNDPSKPTYCATQDDLRQRIRNEWRVEFCFEGDHRQWDARRWNIATDVLNAPRYTYKYRLYKDEANALPEDNGYVCDLYVGESQEITEQILRYEPHNYLLPINNAQIKLNNKLTQNPGYTY